MAPWTRSACGGGYKNGLGAPSLFCKLLPLRGVVIFQPLNIGYPYTLLGLTDVAEVMGAVSESLSTLSLFLPVSHN